MGNTWYVIFLAFGLIILGGSYPKVALAIAGLIFFGAVLLNVDKYKDLLS